MYGEFGEFRATVISKKELKIGVLLYISLFIHCWGISCFNTLVKVSPSDPLNYPELLSDSPLDIQKIFNVFSEFPILQTPEHYFDMLK